MTELRLSGSGLMEMGHCAVTPDDGLKHDSGTLVLLGPDEPIFWGIFTDSGEYQDDQPDPMDRWSQRVIDDIAKTAGGVAYYPFGGAPFLPFYTWALRTGRSWASPIGFLVHDTAGLFASYRGAIWLPENRKAVSSKQPCLTCDNRCKPACPVGAFDDGYDVVACKSHVNTARGAPCLTQGCQARRACPVGADRRLDAQAAFHMEAFR